MERTVLPFSQLKIDTPPIEDEMSIHFPAFSTKNSLKQILINEIKITKQVLYQIPEAYERRGNGRSS